MIKNKASLKAKVANLAFNTNISNKYIIQIFMFESLLKRISIFKYKDGGLLSSIFGINF